MAGARPDRTRRWHRLRVPDPVDKELQHGHPNRFLLARRLAGHYWLDPCPGSALADDATPRTVSVTGPGEVKAQPDMARVTLGVEARSPTLAEARAEVTATVDRLLALTRDLKIDPKYVNSTRLQVQPEYSWNEKDRKQVLLGYVVSRQVDVELRDLDQLGTPAREGGHAQASTRSAAPGSTRHDARNSSAQAMTRAVEDARLNAEALARAAGASSVRCRS